MDMFADPMADILARLAALEAAVFAKAQKPAKVTPEEALSEAWAKWDRHRSGKKGWTADARTLSMRTLRKLAGADGTLALQIVEQSIEFGWQGLFPLKDEPAKTSPPAKQKTKDEALAPTESKLENAINHARQMYVLHGDAGQLEADIAAAKERFS